MLFTQNINKIKLKKGVNSHGLAIDSEHPMYADSSVNNHTVGLMPIFNPDGLEARKYTRDRMIKCWNALRFLSNEEIDSLDFESIHSNLLALQSACDHFKGVRNRREYDLPEDLKRPMLDMLVFSQKILSLTGKIERKSEPKRRRYVATGE